MAALWSAVEIEYSKTLATPADVQFTDVLGTQQPVLTSKSAPTGGTGEPTVKNGAAGSAIDQAGSAESDGLVSSVSHANAAIGTWKNLRQRRPIGRHSADVATSTLHSLAPALADAS